MLVMFEVGSVNAGSDADLRWMSGMKWLANHHAGLFIGRGSTILQLEPEWLPRVQEGLGLGPKQCIVGCIEDQLACLSCDICSDILCDSLGQTVSIPYPENFWGGFIP